MDIVTEKVDNLEKRLNECHRVYEKQDHLFSRVNKETNEFGDTFGESSQTLESLLIAKNNVARTVSCTSIYMLSTLIVL